ncbi:MAG: DUF1616 domain-containing protein, partial [Candidatus Bathyarchaeia archaeon]
MSWILDEEVLAVLAAILVVSAVFAVAYTISYGRVVEPFSELGILGSKGKIGDYPREVLVGQPFQLNVYVGNHEGRAMFYKILVKHVAGSNASPPIAVDPILEVRVILQHNSSRTTQIWITLYEPTARSRLVFEMWIFNESIGGFSYKGIWNQLWLNVSSIPFVEPPQPVGVGVVSRYIEDRLVDGYRSVRRAEESGGDISEMVRLLNEALKLAEMGDEVEADRIVDRVLSMEPGISSISLEHGRMKAIYTMVACIAVASAIGFGFLYIRGRVWLWWVKLYRGWRVVCVGEDSKLEGLDKVIGDRVRRSGGCMLGEILSTLTVRYEPSMIAKTIYKLTRGGCLKLIDPDPPRSILAFAISRYNLGSITASILIALCILSVYTSNLSQAIAILRVMLGSVFVLFIPGYSLIEALYPGSGDLSPLERLALSIGLSLAVVPLVGLILNYTPWGIRLDPTITALSILSLTLLSISSYRKFRILELKF